MEDCVFCDLVAGTRPLSLVAESPGVMAFMDIQPVNRGHVLVVPKRHATNLADLDEMTGGHIFALGMRVAAALRASGIPCEGINLFLADGAAAGQEVFHVHLHVFPRNPGDGFGLKFSPNYHVLPPRRELDRIARKIRRALEA